jgi:hypothetical protein
MDIDIATLRRWYKISQYLSAEIWLRREALSADLSVNRNLTPRSQAANWKESQVSGPATPGDLQGSATGKAGARGERSISGNDAHHVVYNTQVEIKAEKHID